MNSKVPFVDLAAQYLCLQKEIDGAISRVLESGWFILGKELQAFEKEFAEYCGVGFCVGVGSGTEALHLSLLACGIEPGDRVATAPNTAFPTAAAISAARAEPVFVDIDPRSYTLDPGRLKDLLKRSDTPGDRVTVMPRAIIPVHLYGQTADMDPILEWAENYKIMVIEDACQAHGALYKSRMAGSIGHAGCFSFYPTKNLGAYGDAGMITTNDEKIYERLLMLRNYGEKKKYFNAIRGFNSRLDELQASVLRIKLLHLDRWNQERRRLAARYDETLTEIGMSPPYEAEYARHIYHLYTVRTERRDRLQDWLDRKGIVTGVHYPRPVHLQPAFRDLGYQEGNFPEAEEHCRQTLSLPLYPEMRESQVERVCIALEEFCKRVG